MAEVGLAVTVGSTLLGMSKSKKAAKADRRAAALERRATEIQNARERKVAIAVSISRQAAIEAQAAAGGTLGSSAVAGAHGAIASQTASEIGFQQSLEQLGVGIQRQKTKAGKFQTQAQTFGAIAGLPAQFGWKPTFGTQTPAPIETRTPSQGLPGFNPGK